MFSLNSSSVVAPIQWSSPRASAGLSMFPASNDPSALPAPTIVCISSMNKIYLSLFFSISLITDFNLSSKSPLNLEPAKSAARSSCIIILSFKPEGTSLLIILCAKPSIMAVLPTPGSPLSTGLFLVRLCRT